MHQHNNRYKMRLESVQEFSTMWTIAAALLVVGLPQTWILTVNAASDPVIPTTVDKEFIKFQKAVVLQQTISFVDALYGNLDDYKNGFEQFKATGVINTETTTGNVDTDFEQFQKFITRYFREYNNMDEFVIRYNLFLTILNKAKGYNIGGDLVGINRLSDRTYAEKRAQFGRTTN